jgi:aspartate dehydrogenase
MGKLSPRRIGVVGYGAIGSEVGSALENGKVPGAVLTCICTREATPSSSAPNLEIAEALTRCDLIVECAGQGFIAEWAETILDAGIDLLISSIGALADPELAERLSTERPGRVYFTAGAIGGLDLLGAASDAAAFDQVRVTTTKLPTSLIQPWMSLERAAELTNTSQPLNVFEGSAQEAARLFPRSLNVAAAVAIAVNDWDRTAVQLIADPAATLTCHVIEAQGAAGQYRFEIRNDPSPDNPRTSRIVPYAVVRSLTSIVGTSGRFAS